MVSSAPVEHEHAHLLACHDCDALFQAPELHEGDSIVCPHCSAKLSTHRPHGVRRAAAFSLSAASFFVIANIFPFIELKAGGQISRIVLAESVSALNLHGSPWLAAAVAVFILGAPALMISGLLYLMLPLHFGRRLPGAIGVCRAVFGTDTWNMIEVFLLGVLVSLLKLGDIATVTLGISFWAFACLIVCLIAAVASIDKHELWNRLEEARG